MKLSLALASLGLCVAPAFADPIGWMILTSDREIWQETPESQQCLPNYTPEAPLSEIYIKGNTLGSPMECFFYREEGCQGPSTALDEGQHKFPGDFYTTSFLCLNP